MQTKVKVGQRYGRLVVVEWVARIRKKWKNSNATVLFWLCRCDCGTETLVMSGNLRKNHSTSCGCKRDESGRRQLTKHGAYGKPEYLPWRSMINRCRNPKDNAYPKYGAKGIVVCDEWVESFDAFFEAVGPRPSPDHSLDRIEAKKGYVPGNVRWATPLQQARNRTGIRTLTFRGQTRPLVEWADQFGVKPMTLVHRLTRGWSIEKALLTPARSYTKKPA